MTDNQDLMIRDEDADEFLAKRIQVEAELGQRSFIDFYKMAWPYMDPEPFTDGNHIRIICHHLQLAARREIQQLVICIPPRYSKSLMCSVAFPAWIWTWWPSAKFITSSYAQPLATRDALATRRLVESPWYRERWPEVRFHADQRLKTHYQTTAGGVRFVGSPGTGVTGHGSDFNLFDDPHDITKAESEAEREMARIFWFETMNGRFNDPKRGVSIVIQQRTHMNDVAGECIRRGYTSVVLPARFELLHPQLNKYDWRTIEGEPLWPGKFNDDVLKQLWRNMGSDYAIAGQQQQRPQPREGGLFKRHWFRIVEAIPEGIAWVRAWDLASSEKLGSSDPDWTAGCKLGYHAASNTYFLGNMVRDRLDPGGMLRMVQRTAEQDGKQVPIFLPQDPGQAGKVEIQFLTGQLGGYVVRSSPVTGSKVDRASPVATQSEVGNVALYRAGWNEDFLTELTEFPTGMHDDQVDAFSAAFAMFVDTTVGLYDWTKAHAERMRRESAELRAAMGLPPEAIPLR